MDPLILAFDRAIRTLSGAVVPRRPSPAASVPAPELTASEQSRSASLMRVNHAGEVAAQALYQGQAFATRSSALREKLGEAADEELDHLAWTRDRIHELGGHTSLLDPLWYAGAFAIGSVAGAINDKTSLGFLQATEEQVEAHLATHLDQLPAGDTPSRAIVRQMKEDEAGHAQTARTLGARELPFVAQRTMRIAAKVMTTLAARI
jgi:ubiquinone biosynthesis monooxygenase Coq7